MRTQQAAFGKRQVVGTRQDDVISPVRVAGAGMGGAAAAWGVPRLANVGRAVDRGVKSTAPGTAARAREVKGMIGAAVRVTEPIGNTTAAVLGRSPEGRYLMRLAPQKLRPAIATGTGAYALHRSIPVRRVKTRLVER